MALYWFQIESPLPAQAVLERIGSLVREPPTLRQSVKEAVGGRPRNSPPFIGTVAGNRFRVHRDIRYNNSFLPRIHGQVEASPRGTHIKVTMSLHPAVAVFALVWLGAVGFGALAAAGSTKPDASLFLLGMFLFGLALTLVGFFPEAFKARRLLEQNLAGVSAQPDGPAGRSQSTLVPGAPSTERRALR